MFRTGATFGLINRALRSLSHGPLSRPVSYTSINSATRNLKFLQSEYSAVRALLRRSGLTNAQIDQSLERALSTSNCQYSSQPPPPPSQPSSSSGGTGPQQSGDKDGKKNNKDEDDDKNNENITSLIAKAFLLVLTAYMILLGLTLLLGNSNQSEQIFRYVSWNEFVHQMLAKGEVEELIVRPDLDMVTIILYEGAVVKGRKVDFNTFHMNIADTVKFEEKLRAAEAALGIPNGQGVQVVYERGGDTAGKLLVSIIVAFILLSILSRGRSLRSPLSMDRVSQLGRAKFTLIDPHRGEGRGVKFEDVAGLKEVKMEVMEIVDYLKKPERYKLLGAKVPKGVLLLGPPGCGKTLLAKAIATEAEIPFLSMNGSEFIEMIGGLGAARVRDLFKEGRKRTPCIIYIDEIDAMGRKRSGSEMGGFGGTTGESEQTLNQLLVEMDGIASKEGVLLLASTNRADVLDKALLRPGRFDRHILIDLPTVQERQEIFVQHLKSVKVDGNITEYAKRLAYLTPGFSGADIANVVNESALHAARFLKENVDKKDLEYAIERVVGGTEKQSHAMTPAEKKTVSVHEAGHALVGWLTPEADVLLKVSIVPRTNLALGFAQYTPSDQKLYTKEQLLGRMRMALGGRAAEATVFNRVTTGAQNDLKKVTDMAYSMVRSHGMSSTIGPLSYSNREEGRRPYSKKLSAAIDMEANRVVASAYQDVEKILAENRDKLDKLSTALFEKETLEYADVEKLLGPPVGENRRFVHPVDFELSLKQASDEREQPPPTPKESEEPDRMVPCTPVATV